MIRLLATGHPLPSARRQGVWVELGRLMVLSGLCITFHEDVEDGQRTLVMLTSPVLTDCPPACFQLPIAEPLRYRIACQLELMPRAVRLENGRPAAMFVHYIDHSTTPPGVTHGRSA